MRLERNNSRCVLTNVHTYLVNQQLSSKRLFELLTRISFSFSHENDDHSMHIMH